MFKGDIGESGARSKGDETTGVFVEVWGADKYSVRIEADFSV